MPLALDYLSIGDSMGLSMGDFMAQIASVLAVGGSILAI